MMRGKKRPPFFKGRVRLTTESIEVILRSSPYKTVRVPEVEEKMQSATTMIEVFHNFIQRWGRPPKQWEFARACSRAGGPYYRAARAWASLMMEEHLIALLREAGYDPEYSIEDDVEKGIDITINCGGRRLRLHAYFATEKGKEWTKIKREIRHPEEGEVIEFPLYPDEARVVGNVHLYTKDHLMLIQLLCS